MAVRRREKERKKEREDVEWEKLERVIIHGCVNKRGLINTAKDALERVFHFRYCNMEGRCDCFPNPYALSCSPSPHPVFVPRLVTQPLSKTSLRVRGVLFIRRVSSSERCGS